MSFRTLIPVLITGFAASVLPSAAVAQQDTTSKVDTLARHPATVLDPIVVTAERRPTPASDVTAPVIVVDSGAIARRAASDITTILRDVAGIQPEAVVGSGSGIYLQGLGSDRVLVLLDGSPMAGRLDGQFDLSRISPAALDRVEIVEGPQSTLYGSTALGGVVNLITSHGVVPGAEFSSTFGSFGQRDYTGRLGTPVAGLFASLEGDHRGVDAVPGANPGTTGSADRWDWMARVEGDIGHAALDARLMTIDENQRYAISPARITSTNRQYDGLVRLTFGASGQTDVRLHGSWYDHRFVAGDSTGTQPPSWGRQRIADAEVVQRGTLGASAWVAGAKLDHAWLLSDRVSGYRRDASTGALYGSVDWALAPVLHVTTGVRVTNSRIWGTDLSPRLGAALRAPAGLYLKAEVAHGFRAPSFEEQYFDLLQAQFGYAVHGNPALKAEQSWNVTGELGLSRAALHVSVRGFSNSLRDFIEPNMTGDSSGILIFTYQNVDRARTGGVEAAASASRGIATASLSYTWLSTRDITTNTDLLGRAAHTANASLAIGRDGWSAAAAAVYTGREPVARDQAGVVTYQGAFTRINVSGVVPVTRGVRFTLGADNLTDAKPSGGALIWGRRLYAQASAGLGW
jgi:outer membrane receptor for ferrienterochelin and colicins